MIVEFDGLFRQVVSEVNQRLSHDANIQNALGRYNGRSLVFKVRGDATYVFYFSSNGVTYKVSPSKIPNDMYVEMDLGRARRLVHQRSLGILDLPFITYRKISLADVNFAKQILSGF
jgi:hypothetical protein